MSPSALLNVIKFLKKDKTIVYLWFPTRARLFKINDIVSSCFVKILKVNITNTLLFFVEKNVRIFCTAKDSHIFPTINNFFRQKIIVYSIMYSAYT